MTISPTAAAALQAADTMGEARRGRKRREEREREEGEFRSIHRSIIFAVFRSCHTGNGNEPTGRKDGRMRAAYSPRLSRLVPFSLSSAAAAAAAEDALVARATGSPGRETIILLREVGKLEGGKNKKL